MNGGLNFGQFASGPGRGAIPPSSVGADFDVVFHSLTPGSNTTQQLPANPDRFALFLCSQTDFGSIFWQFKFEVNASQMNQIPVNQHPIVLTYRDLGPLITFPIYAKTDSPGTFFNLYEIIYRPRR